MIENTAFGPEMRCNECGDAIRHPHDDGFQALLSHAKSYGWKIVKADDGWEHY